jgi:ribonuclease P protein component
MSEAHIPAEQSEACKKARLPEPYVDPGWAGHPQGAPGQRPRPAVRLIWRVDRRELFVALRSAPRARSGPLTVSCLPAAVSDGGQPPRVGFTVARRVGTAVTRNRLRRQLRSYVRADLATLPAGTYLIRVHPTATECGYWQLGEHLERAIQRLPHGARNHAATNDGPASGPRS